MSSQWGQNPAMHPAGRPGRAARGADRAIACCTMSDARIPPFVQVAGCDMLVVNWSPGLTTGDYLVLRPLRPDERAWLERALADAWADVLARLAPSDALRLGGPA